MRGAPRSLRVALGIGVAVFAAVGCLVVAPLDPLPEAASEAKGGSGNGGDDSGSHVTAASGSAGEAGSGECTTNADCVLGSAEAPYRCRPSDHTCVALETTACPLAYGDATNPNAIFFGTFAPLIAANPADNSVVWAERLALDELSGKSRVGLPGGPRGALRPLVMLVCNNYLDGGAAGLLHLEEEVQVPAIVAMLKPDDLLAGFDRYRSSHETFYLSPVPVNHSVVAADDQDLLWGLLGQTSDLAPIYPALLAQAGKRVRKTRNLSDADPIKVALVTTGAGLDAELTNAVAPLLRFNGDLTAEGNQRDGNFTSLELAADRLEDQTSQLINFGPDVILSTASELFSKSHGFLENVEENWDVMHTSAAKPHPFYVLSSDNGGNLGVIPQVIADRIEAGELDAPQRFVGVTIAGARDTTLQSQYAVRLSKYPADRDTANFYDAVYFLAYAMYAAGTDAELTGPRIAQGMRRLLSGDDYNVGAYPVSEIDEIFKALSGTDSSIHLVSTLGSPPDFDPESGVRPIEGGVFCFSQNGGQVGRVNSQLRFDREMSMLSGTFHPPCFDGFYP